MKQNNARNENAMIKRRLAALALIVIVVLAAASLLRRSRPKLEAVRVPLSGSGSKTIAVAFSPDSKTLAGGGEEGVMFWDAETGGLLKTLEGFNCSSLAYSPDGKTLAAAAGANRDERALILIDVQTDAVKTLEKLDDTVLTAAYSPNGKTVASVGKNLTTKKHTIRIWDAKTGDPLHALPAFDSDKTTLTYTPDGETLISFYCAPKIPTVRSREYKLAFWDVDGGYKRIEPPAFQYRGSRYDKAAAYSPNGQRMAVAAGSFVLLFDAYTAEFVQSLEHCEWGPSVSSLAYSPDSKLLASGGDAETDINLWNAYTGEHLKGLSVYHTSIWDLTFSPDGTKLACIGFLGWTGMWKIDPVNP